MGVLFKSFPINTHGRDFAVGDIHGHFSLLMRALAAVRFDPDKDRLFSVGDIVDRGPESERFAEFLALPWFHAARGNHEQLLIDAPADSWWANTWYNNGGVWGWVQGMDTVTEWARLLDELPIAMEVKIPGGKQVGLLHADPMLPSWWAVRQHLEAQEKKLARPFSMDGFTKEIQGMLWSRGRLSDMACAAECDEPYDDFPGVAALVMGHSIMAHPLHVGNCWAIDTGAYQQAGTSALTLLNLHTFETHVLASAPPQSPADARAIETL
jgi:serine/threonine protein phosphatase 1